jgi:hypothetical protein
MSVARMIGFAKTRPDATTAAYRESLLTRKERPQATAEQLNEEEDRHEYIGSSRK